MADFGNVRPGPAVWGVASLLLAVGDALSARFGAVAVRGELSGFTRASSGHCYFTLKDGSGNAAGIRCAMFRRSAQLLAFAPQDGQQVEVRGRLAVYEARGELQMVVESLQRVGTGTLYEEYLRLKAALERAGYFAAERKRALPSFPRRIGLITSAQGAALHDVLTTFARRAPYLEIVLYPSLVQGAEAPAALVAAIELANRRAEVDVLLLCRGGGSLEDLWAFNDERVVQAIARSALVLVCGVGHETDVTLADLTADLRAATPTAAAELAAPARAVLMTELEHREQALQRRLMARLDSAAQRLDRLALRLQQPARTLHRQLDRLQSLERRSIQALRTSIKTARIGPKDLQARLVRALDSNLERRHLALEARQDKLEALDPRHVLARGYAWMENRDGQAIVSARGLSTGQRVRAVWLDGSAESTLERIVLKPDMAPLARPPENGAH